MTQEGSPPPLTEGGPINQKEGPPIPPGGFIGKEGMHAEPLKEVEMNPSYLKGWLAKYREKPEESALILFYQANFPSEFHYKRNTASLADEITRLATAGATTIPKIDNFDVEGELPYIVTQPPGRPILEQELTPELVLEVIKQLHNTSRVAYGMNMQIPVRIYSPCIYWDEQSQRVTSLNFVIFQQEGISDDTKTDDAREFSLLFHSFYQHIPKAEVNEATSPTIKAMLRLAEITASYKSKGGGTVIFTKIGNKILRETRRHRFFEFANRDHSFDSLLDKILSGQDPTTLESDIERWIKRTSDEITISSDDEPVDFVQHLGKNSTLYEGSGYFAMEEGLLSGQNLNGDIRFASYLALLRNSLGPGGSLSWFCQTMRKHINEVLSPYSRDGVATDFVIPLRFILALGKQLEGLENQHFDPKSIRQILEDMVLIKYRPDIASNGNRRRLKEGLEKLGQVVDLSVLEGIDEIRKLTKTSTEQRLAQLLTLSDAQLKSYHAMMAGYGTKEAAPGEQEVNS